MQKNVVFLKTAAGLGMCTGIWYIELPVLPNRTVTVARRKRGELCIQLNVQLFDYHIFSPLISLWC
ncbi:hypothetical protein E2C01_020317 [Portunus trituberculatus]|uniref:Uncharacterized protein n=1 Tax=Portunus trituberculatus TaxID=210409 RepID=A0A5B7E1N8_PORTR|nr:hypothetical protein [Portunus trituberculatus]